ncbi:MAG: NifU family protein [Calditrichaeota bacterium]|nr:MAG: NifU family protein [Calditrichota bacterium]
MPTYDLNQKIEDIFDKMLRPAIAMDGGILELVEIKEGKVKVAMKGACGTCPSSLITLKNGIEKTLREELNLPNLIVENVNQSETSNVVLGWG